MSSTSLLDLSCCQKQQRNHGMHRMPSWWMRAVGAILCMCLGWHGQAQAEHQPQLPQGIVGTLHSIGSDTLGDVVTQWAGEFSQRYPHARLQIQTAGSSAAPIAIIGGTASIGPMSRPLRPSETRSFVDKYGYQPTMLKVGIDAIGVFVHLDNPIESITAQQLDALFSQTRYCGAVQSITRWSQLYNNITDDGAIDALKERDIRMYGRNSASGTYSFFKANALCFGDYKAAVKQQPSSSAIIRAVANSPVGIGYASIGALNNQVKPLALTNREGVPIALTQANIQAGKYPLNRYLYLMINHPPGQALSPTLLAFLQYVLSDNGQLAVQRAGYVPMPKPLLDSQLRQITRTVQGAPKLEVLRN